VAVGNQDGRGVPVPATVLPGGLDEPLHLPLRQVIAASGLVKGGQDRA
jgi:hypothetical protein